MLLKRAKRNSLKATVWLLGAMFALPATPMFASCCATVSQGSCCCCDAQSPLGVLGQGGRSAVLNRTQASDRFANTSACCSSATASRYDGCSCCDSCPCKLQDHSSQPATPSSPEESSASKIVAGAVADCLALSIVLPTIKRRGISKGEIPATRTSLQRCISLSRFAL